MTHPRNAGRGLGGLSACHDGGSPKLKGTSARDLAGTGSVRVASVFPWTDLRRPFLDETETRAAPHSPLSQSVERYGPEEAVFARSGLEPLHPAGVYARRCKVDRAL